LITTCLLQKRWSYSILHQNKVVGGLSNRPANLHSISTHVPLPIATIRIENDLVNNFI